MTSNELKHQAKVQEWGLAVQKSRNSGISVKRRCSENGTIPKNYYSWQKKVFAFMVEQQKSQFASNKR